MDCPLGHGPMTSGQDFWVCLTCGEKVLATPPPLSPYPEGLDPTDLPAYLAHPWKAYWDEGHPRVQLAWLVDTAELCVRWAVALALAEVVHTHGGALPAGVAAQVRDHVERPTLGRWLAVLRALCEAKPEKPLLVPEVFGAVSEVVTGAFSPDGAAETSLLVLRNEVAHAGGLSTARARELLGAHRERFESLMRAVVGATRDVEVLAVDERGAVRLGGTAPERVERPAGVPADLRGPCLAGAAGALPLWPLATFGPVRLIDGNGTLAERGGGPAPLVYFRSHREVLDYTPLGRDEAHAEELDAEIVRKFRDLFRLDAARARHRGEEVDGFLPGDFLVEARLAAEDLVGRKAELQIIKDWLKRRDGRAEGAARIGWISGGPGVGKSMLVARVAADLANTAAERQGLFFHRFGAGNGRNSRRSFLRLLQAALWAWEPLRAVTEAPAEEAVEGRKLEEDVKARLAKVGDLPPSNPKTPQPRFLVFADGLDELAPLDPRFPDLVKDLALPGTVWVLAGRSEHGLDKAFQAPGCEAIFGPPDHPDGLPLMSPDDIREMLERGLGLGRHALLKRDEESPDGAITNRFVARVVERAQGLPLYVHLLLDDLRQGHYTVRDEDKLPPGLNAYYDQILGRIGLSTVRSDLSALVCYLAKAAEPLDADALALLVAGGVKPARDLGYRKRIDEALRAGRSLLRAAPAVDGGDGWTLYHQSFREYVAGRPQDPKTATPGRLPAAALEGTVREAEYRLVRAADWWEELPAGDLRNHLFRWGVRYALEWGKEEGLQTARRLLTNFAYLMARTEALPGSETTVLAKDYASVLSRVSPEEQRDFSIWEAFFRERTHILRRGTPAWPPNRILLELAVEDADESPITKRAEDWLDLGHCHWIWLRNPRRVAQPAPNPCLRVLEGHNAWIKGAKIAPDGRILSWSEDGDLRLWSAQGDPMATLQGHSGAVVGAHLLSDGRILSWAEDGTLRLWSEEGTHLATLEGHNGMVDGVQPLSDGRILSWAEDGTLRLWSATGTPLTILEGHSRRIVGVHLLPADRILSWSHDETLRLWSAVGTPLATLKGHTDSVRGAQILADGRILSWAADGTFRLWSAEGTPVATLKGHTGSVRGAQPLRDGRILSWSTDGTLRLWSAEGTSLATLDGHAGWVQGAQILADGRILSWAADGTLRLWSAKGTPVATLKAHTRRWPCHRVMEVQVLTRVLPNGRILSWAWRSQEVMKLWSAEGDLLANLEGHSRPIEDTHLFPDGRILSWGDDGTLRLWSAEGTPLVALEGHIGSVVGTLLMPDGCILSWGEDRTLRLWSAEGTPLVALERHIGSVVGTLLMPDGCILSWGEDRTLRLWAADGTPLATLVGHTGAVRGAQLLPDGCILSWAWDSRLRIWSAAGQPMASLNGHYKPVSGACVLPDGRILSWSRDTTLRLWSEKGVPLSTLEGHNDRVVGARILPDGRILSWSEDGNLRLWSREGAPLATLEGPGGWVDNARLMPDGRILSWGLDLTARLWSPQGTLLVTIEGHKGALVDARILPDGRILSWSEDGTLRLWTAEGTPLATLQGHTGSVEGAQLLSDGRILSWSIDGMLRLWSAQGAPLVSYDTATAPGWIVAAGVGPSRVQEGLAARTLGRSVTVAGAKWHATCGVAVAAFLPDGTVIVTLESGHVFCLKLHHGTRRVTAAEAAEIFKATSGEATDVSENMSH